MDATRLRRAREMWEVVLPGCAIGLAGGLVIGVLGALGGLPAGRAVAAALLLGVPLAAAGAGYDGLLLAGRMGIGTFAPAVAFWLPLFPLARYLDETLSDVLAGDRVGVPGGVGPFLAYQAIVSLGYAIGFVFLHEQVAPRWWLRVADHNPAAGRILDRYADHAALMVRTGRRRAGRD